MSWLNPYRWLAIAALIAALMAGLWRLDLSRQAIGYERAVAEQAVKDLAAEQVATKETQRRIDRQKENDDAQAQQLKKLALDATTATAAAGKLRSQVAALVAASKSNHPAAEPGSPPAGTALDLLSLMFSELDDRAGILGAALDRSHAAGLRCTQDYDALTP